MRSFTRETLSLGERISMHSKGAALRIVSFGFPRVTITSGTRKRVGVVRNLHSTQPVIPVCRNLFRKKAPKLVCTSLCSLSPQVSFLHHTVYVLAVGPIHGIEILLDGDVRNCRAGHCSMNLAPRRRMRGRASVAPRGGEPDLRDATARPGRIAYPPAPELRSFRPLPRAPKP